jgi:hypothetical protein
LRASFDFRQLGLAIIHSSFVGVLEKAICQCLILDPLHYHSSMFGMADSVEFLQLLFYNLRESLNPLAKIA